MLNCDYLKLSAKITFFPKQKRVCLCDWGIFKIVSLVVGRDF